MKRTTFAFGLLAVLLAVGVAPVSAAVLYTQPYDGTGNLFTSQNDTASYGLYAQIYDDFKLSANSSITEVSWTGGYFNPALQGPITQFTVDIYSDDGGQPGATPLATEVFSGTAGETFLGNAGGFPTYTYDVTLGTAFAATAGTTYWLSVYPNLSFPPEWGWATGTGGNGSSYQDFFGTRSQLSSDFAFTLGGTSGPVIPEPSTFGLLGLGLVGMTAFLRRKASR